MRAAPPLGPEPWPSPYGCSVHVLWRDCSEGMEEMTASLDVRTDIRSMDADGVPKAEIAHRLRLSRNTDSGNGAKRVDAW